MKTPGWSRLRRLPELLTAETLQTEQQIARVHSLERNIGLPVRAGFILLLAYYLFFSRWLMDVSTLSEVVLEAVRWFLIIYALISAAAAAVLIIFRDLSWGTLRWLVFTVSLLDGLFLAAVTVSTGGFDSGLYWVFIGLIIRNAISVPVAALQIMLNLAVCACYLVAGMTDLAIEFDSTTLAGNEGFAPEPTEPFLIRVFLLVLMTLCGYGVQVLFDRSMRAQEETREFSLRQGQLQSAGRLAAEIAHQLKNPLSIINNAAFNLEKSVAREVPGDAARQIQIIREEVHRSDQIITQIMGYAQLAEGKVERVNLIEQVEQAIKHVFPPGLKLPIRIEREYGPNLPSLFFQRRHLSEILENLLQNAREALPTTGTVRIAVQRLEPSSVRIEIGDDGPGIASDQQTAIFQPYVTTKEKGTGLGLAIVKHNVDLYNGTIRLESELGKGARFILEFPTKTQAALAP